MRSLTLRNWTSVLAVAVILIAFSAPVAQASEAQEAYISEVALAGLDALLTGDVAGVAEAEALLYDTSQDPATAPACRLYADIALGSTVLLEGWARFPENDSLGPMNSMLMEALILSKNDCRLAI